MTDIPGEESERMDYKNYITSVDVSQATWNRDILEAHSQQEKESGDWKLIHSRKRNRRFHRLWQSTGNEFSLQGRSVSRSVPNHSDTTHASLGRKISRCSFM